MSKTFYYAVCVKTDECLTAQAEATRFLRSEDRTELEEQQAYLHEAAHELDTCFDELWKYDRRDAGRRAAGGDAAFEAEVRWMQSVQNSTTAMAAQFEARLKQLRFIK